MARTQRRKSGRKIPPVHPGTVLLEEFLEPMGISQYRLAKDLGIDQRRISLIVQGKRAITAETDLLLSHYFGISAGIWLGLQKKFELHVEQDRLGDKLKSLPTCEAVAV